MNAILDTLIDIARFFIVFGLAVIVHEWGHMIVAKLCGARVQIFSIGFGRKLWGIKRGETEYQIALVPVGGYVKIAGMDPTEELTGAPWEFLSISPLKRILILFAGPGMNVVLAFLIYYALFVAVGEPITPTTQIGMVSNGSPGWEIGLRPGDRIAAVGDTQVQTWEQLENAILEHPVGDYQFKIQRDNTTLSKTYSLPITSPLEESSLLPEETTEEIVKEAVSPAQVNGFVVSNVLSGGPAAQVGLQPGDVLVKVAGIETTAIDDLGSLVGQQVQVTDDGKAQAIPIAVEWVTPSNENRQAEIIPEVSLPAEDALPYRPIARLGITYNPRVGVQEFLIPTLPILGVSPKLDPIVGTIKERSPAEQAGLKSGDRILAVDDRPLDDWNELQLQVFKRYEQRGDDYIGLPIRLTWRTRDGEIKTSTITPAVHLETLPTKHGIATGERVPITELGMLRLVDRQKMGIIGGVGAALTRVQTTFTTMLGHLRMLVMGEASRKVFGGPIAIFHMSAETGRWGFELFFKFIAMLSASLALLNLLPIPALDGGHIVLYLYEIIRRKPLTLHQMEMWGRVGVFLFIIPLMIFLIYNDLDRVGLFSKIGSAVLSIFSSTG